MTQGDFNGDGLLDIVYYNHSLKKLTVAINNGNGTFDINHSDEISIDITDDNEKGPDYSLTVCDLDHDGFSDVMVAGKISDKIKTQWLYSDGTTLRLKNEYITTNSYDMKVANSIFSGDFNGDGAEEIANFGAQLNANSNGSAINNFNYYPTEGKSYTEGRISSISDGMGRYIRFNYSCLSSPDVYTKGVSSYPVNSYSHPMSVVINLLESNGDLNAKKTVFSYEDLKYHIAGRGSVGFTSVIRNNLTLNTKQITTISELDKKWFIPTKKTTETIIESDSMKTVVTTGIHTINNNYFSYTSAEETTDYDGNKTLTTYDYDISAGLLLSKKTIYDDSDDMYKSISYSDYVFTGNRWQPGVIESTGKHRDDANIYTNKMSFEYDEAGNVLVRNENDGTSLRLTATNTYDRRGNILSTVKTGTGVIPVTRFFEYDDNGRFMTRTYSLPASAEIRYAYDIWGNLLTETDVTDHDNRLTRSMKYDQWNRLVSETAPDGTKTEYQYGLGQTNEFRSYIRTIKNDVTIETRWFDCLGRERLIKSAGIGGTDIATLTHYNPKGQVSHIESFNGKLVLDKMYSYDHRGRITALNNAGQSTTYSYGNRKTSVSANGHTYINITDSWGNMTYTEDPVSDVTYRYFSNGKPSSVTSEDCTVAMEYDSAGNRIRLEDPDSGVSTFTYAADGALLSHTDAKGVRVDSEFDDIGRIVKIKTGENIVSNIFGTEGYALQRITRRTDGNNHIDYTYDSFGRIIKESRTVNGKGVYDYDFEYDTDGLLSKTIYPGGLEIDYEYDDTGNMTGIRANGDKVWEFIDNDGKLSGSSAINAFVYTQEADDYGYLKKMEYANKSSKKSGFSNEIIQLEHDITTGNLLSRKIGNNSSRTYIYDNMNRLTDVYENDDNLLSVQYADNGNIIHKSDVGYYGYESSRPHAVTSINNASDLVPSSSQFVNYNDLGKIASIIQDSLTMTFHYGPDGERWHSVLTNGNDVIRETIYAGNYEKVRENGVIREYYYIDGGILIIRQNDVFTPYLILADEQGSILSILDESGSRVFSASYDEWGCQKAELNTIGLQRGYTGHEMMPEFGIINMNGRLYDPVLARFFTPDNFIQEPTNSQNFNRYTYCLNNPLKYTDPSGEWFGIDDLLAAAVGGVCGYISNGIKTGNWGMKSVKAGLCSAVSTYIGYNSIGVLSGKASLSEYLASAGVSTISNDIIPSVSIPVTSNASVSVSPMMGMGETGLSCGLGMSLGFDFGNDWNASVSACYGNQYYGGTASFSYKDWGGGFGYTRYNEQTIGKDNTLGAQSVGTISALISGVSIRFSNDCIGDKNDRWRSSAVEIAYKNFVTGTYVTNNDGKEDSKDIGYIGDRKIENMSKYKGKDKGKGIWEDGRVYSSPFWIGFKAGNQVHRFGYSHTFVQKATQNFVHEHLVKTAQFKNYH